MALAFFVSFHFRGREVQGEIERGREKQRETKGDKEREQSFESTRFLKVKREI